MGHEIERKFLVQSDEWRDGAAGVFCRQGYLASAVECTVRVRVIGDEGFLTIKGPTKGITRSEYEYEIPVQDAHELLDQLCQRPWVEKYRYVREYAELKWEIDEFMGDNQGLVVAEVELPTADQEIGLPAWVGHEVSDDPRYLNVNLARLPYKQWGVGAE